MINDELSKLRENPEWVTLLGAYADAKPLENGWLTRVGQVDGISDRQLPGCHGKLIAWGFLDFQISDRNQGVDYQLTPLGRQGLLRAHPGEENASDIQVQDRPEFGASCENELPAEAIASAN